MLRAYASELGLDGARRCPGTRRAAPVRELVDALDGGRGGLREDRARRRPARADRGGRGSRRRGRPVVDDAAQAEPDRRGPRARLRDPRARARAARSTRQHEHERAAGAWHAEWEALSDLLALTGAAAFHVRGDARGSRGRRRADAREPAGRDDLRGRGRTSRPRTTSARPRRSSTAPSPACATGDRPPSRRGQRAAAAPLVVARHDARDVGAERPRCSPSASRSSGTTTRATDALRQGRRRSRASPARRSAAPTSSGSSASRSAASRSAGWSGCGSPRTRRSGSSGSSSAAPRRASRPPSSGSTRAGDRAERGASRRSRTPWSDAGSRRRSATAIRGGRCSSPRRPRATRARARRSRRPTCAADLERITAPTTVVLGRHDPAVDAEAERLLAALGPVVKLDAAHLASVERPAEFAATVLAG